MPRTHRLPDLLGALAGIAFALLLYIGISMINSPRAATDQELVKWWTDGGVLRDLLVSMQLKLVSIACFLVFLAQLRARLRAVDPESPWLDLVYGAGIAFVATFSIHAISRGLIAHAVRFGGDPLPGPDTLRYATQFSDAAFGFVAVPVLTLTVVAASLMILQTGALSRVVGWLGLVVSVLSLVIIALQTGSSVRAGWATPLILIWVIGVSTQLFRARGARVVSAAASPGMASSQPQGLVSQR
jgi:hypothetical protein